MAAELAQCVTGDSNWAWEQQTHIHIKKDTRLAHKLANKVISLSI